MAPTATTELDLAVREADERDAGARLARVNGPGELKAALLALMLTPGSKRCLRAWGLETLDVPGADALRQNAVKLSGAARLPWLERLLGRMARQPLVARQQLLQATRRLIAARGMVRPLDRLHWLVMRRALGEVPALVARDESNVEVAEWLESDVLTVAIFSAFLSRMVPGESPDSPLGRPWYDAVMTAFQPFAEVPGWRPPHSDEMVDALVKMQTLSWMQRPVIVRNWVSTAVLMGRGVRLADLSADALRLSCTLLDSPLPPELTRHYISLEAEPAH